MWKFLPFCADGSFVLLLDFVQDVSGPIKVKMSCERNAISVLRQVIYTKTSLTADPGGYFPWSETGLRKGKNKANKTISAPHVMVKTLDTLSRLCVDASCSDFLLWGPITPWDVSSDWETETGDSSLVSLNGKGSRTRIQWLGDRDRLVEMEADLIVQICLCFPCNRSRSNIRRTGRPEVVTPHPHLVNRLVHSHPPRGHELGQWGVHDLFRLLNSRGEISDIMIHPITFFKFDIRSDNWTWFRTRSKMKPNRSKTMEEGNNRQIFQVKNKQGSKFIFRHRQYIWWSCYFLNIKMMKNWSQINPKNEFQHKVQLVLDIQHFPARESGSLGKSTSTEHDLKLIRRT